MRHMTCIFIWLISWKSRYAILSNNCYFSIFLTFTFILHGISVSLREREVWVGLRKSEFYDDAGEPFILENLWADRHPQTGEDVNYVSYVMNTDSESGGENYFSTLVFDASRQTACEKHRKCTTHDQRCICERFLFYFHMNWWQMVVKPLWCVVLIIFMNNLATLDYVRGSGLFLRSVDFVRSGS